MSDRQAAVGGDILMRIDVTSIALVLTSAAPTTQQRDARHRRRRRRKWRNDDDFRRDVGDSVSLRAGGGGRVARDRPPPTAPSGDGPDAVRPAGHRAGISDATGGVR